MTAWAGFVPPDHSDEAGGIGVNLKKSFDYYDADNSGSMSMSEFAHLMRDLGTPLKGTHLCARMCAGLSHVP